MTFKALHRLLLTIAFLFSAIPALAQTPFPKGQFDASFYNKQEIRFLQAALTFEGTYDGLYDGVWGPRSQTAMQRFAQDNFDRPAQNIDAGRLALRFRRVIRREDWEMRHFPLIRMSALFPGGASRQVAQDRSMTKWAHNDSSLEMLVTRMDFIELNILHQRLLLTHAQSSQPYALRGTNRWVTATKGRNGTSSYARSDLIDGRWSTIVMTVSGDDTAILRTVAGSISPGTAPAIEFPTDGLLESQVKILRKANTNAQSGKERFLGNATLLSFDGHFLTYAPAIAGCENLKAAGFPAKVVMVSKQFDLALLRADETHESRAPLPMAARPPLKGDALTVGRILNQPGRTPDTLQSKVHRLSGPGQDETKLFLQSDLPAQASGAALVNESGAFVGLAIAQEDAASLKQAIGAGKNKDRDFAINGATAAMFLARAGIKTLVNNDTKPMSAARRADTAANAVVKLTCAN